MYTPQHIKDIMNFGSESDYMDSNHNLFLALRYEGLLEYSEKFYHINSHPPICTKCPKELSSSELQ